MSHSRTLSFFLPLRPTFSVFYFALMFFKETFYVLMLRFLEIHRCFCEFCFVMLNNLIWQKQLCKNNNILVVCAGQSRQTQLINLLLIISIHVNSHETAQQMNHITLSGLVLFQQKIIKNAPAALAHFRARKSFLSCKDLL